jgi:hypothetical protein
MSRPDSRTIMISLIGAKTLRDRLGLILAGLLVANSAFTANLVDPQEQARQFIVGRPSFGVAPDLTDARGNRRIDPQEQARQFILGQPSLGVAVDSTSTAKPAVSTHGDRGVYADSQELARRMILGKGA